MENFRIAAKSFIVKDNKLLLLKRDSNDIQKPNIWEIPGGRLELGEDPIKGIKRETKEETGIDIEVLHPLNVRHFNRDDGQTITMLIFLCNALNDNIKLSKEHTAFEWVPLENCKEKLTDFFHKEVDIANRTSLKKIQQEVDEWTQQYKIPYWQPLEILARLTEETGELAREINHRFGAKKKKSTEEVKEIEDELGDIIFTITCLANSLNLDLNKAFSKTMDKCYGRDKNRYEKKTP